MARTARIKSLSGNYHVVLRGINKQRIFEDDQDYEKFLWILKDTKNAYDFSLYAWCLMPNHIHLLIKEKTNPLSRIMQRIGSNFVLWYNRKYDRTGHLFEDRYKSEPVNDDSYFLKVIRYIHLNPVKAGICEKPDDYPYSSYANYFGKKISFGTDELFGIITRNEFCQFHEEKSDDICLDIDQYTTHKLTDEQASHIIIKVSGCERTSLVQSLNDEERTLVIKKALHEGASVRQINRLTGVTVRVIENIRQGYALNSLAAQNCSRPGNKECIIRGDGYRAARQ